MSIFKACEIRGIYPDEINEGKAYRIARALATILDGQTVVVGGDLRRSTEGLKTAVIDGLISSSCNAIDIDIVPSPVFQRACQSLGAASGIMVTASHYPAEFNGMKILVDHLPITSQLLMRINAMLETNGFLSARGAFSVHDAHPDYLQFIRTTGRHLLRDVAKMPKVVMDCGNGCLSCFAPDIFDELAIPTFRLFCQPDGMFPNRDPKPTEIANLSTLRQTVVETRSDLGIAFDGDGDVAVFVDQNGAVLSNDQAAAVFVRHAEVVLPEDNVIIDIKCSDAVSEVVRQKRATPIAERSNHSDIRTRMVSENAKLGLEVNGHIFHGELGGIDDALYSAIMMTRIVGLHGPLSRLARAIPRFAITSDITIKIGHAPVLIDAIAEAFPTERVNRLDGIRVQFEDGWGIARLSTNKSKVNLRFEGKDEPSLRRIVDEFLCPTPDLKKELIKSFKSA